MPRFFLHLAYKGSNYHGWQKQVDVPSVQETIEDALFQLYARTIHCHGCGRTDKGVHASQFYAHIDLNKEEIDRLPRLKMILPDDILLKEHLAVSQELNAQFDAKLRTYTYKIHFEKSPTIEEISALYDKEDYDLEILKEAFHMIKPIKDFEYFCKTPDTYKSTICEIEDVAYEVVEKNKVHLHITADRFLRSMIRYLIAALLDVASGKISLVTWAKILNKTIPVPHRKEAHPQGLYLSKVVYDDL